MTNLSWTSATPSPAPLAMPTQALNEAPHVVFAPVSARTTIARLIVFGGAAMLTIYGYRQMTLVFGNEFRSALEWLLLVLFTVTFGWIALSSTQALASLLSVSRGRKSDGTEPLHGKTALIMPVYNEDPAETCAALFAMGDGLAALGHGQSVEIFILSDTRNPSVWLKETASFQWLRTALSNNIAVWYRRRQHNTGRKAGNLRQFVECWGGRYDYMLVLDADSLLAPETIVELIRRMDRSPKLGILQTVPMLTGGRTLFARIQQFAGRLYGDTISRGVDAWQGVDGNYWGHNALIRVKAYADNCGLPELPGRMPFGGHVLSHDFVEAALIRRGGWEVRMDPDLGGSWEGAPPSLLDLSVRDRRWAQGNLQHMKVVGAHGLRLPSRVHLLVGIAAYLMAPIWLALLLVGAALTTQSLFIEPSYFPDGLQLFPHWPVFDAQRMARLFALAMGLLLLPKLIGLLRGLLIGRIRRAMGGPIKVVSGALFEVFLSALYAPILMFMQVRHIFEIVSGRDSGWSTQQRDGAELPWRVAFARHSGHVLWGLIPLLVIGWFVPEQLIWLAPVIAGLILSPLLSRLSGSPAWGLRLQRWGLLVTPEEIATPPAEQARAQARAAAVAASEVDLLMLTRDEHLLRQHMAALDEVEASEAEVIASVTARAKIDAADSAQQALRWLSAEEHAALVGSRDLLRQFAQVHPGAALGEMAPPQTKRKVS